MQSKTMQTLSELDALRQSEQRNKLILENANDLFSIHRFNDLSYVYVNPATLNTLGYSEEELKKISVVNLIHKNDRMNVLKIIRRNLNSGEGQVEFRYRKKDGTFIWLEAKARFIPDKEEPLLVIICRDITDRKQAEEKLQKAYDQLELKVQERTAQLEKVNEELKRKILLVNASEERFRILFEQAPLGITINREGIILFANQAFCKMFGYENISELCGTAIINRVAPMNQNEIAEKMKIWEEGKELPTSQETVAQKKDGSRIPVFVAITHILLSDGPANIVYVSDISERKQAETTLKNQVELHKLLLNISRQFTKVMSKDIDELISSTLQMIGEFDGCDRSYVFLFSDDGSMINKNYEWCAEGIENQKNYLNLRVDRFPWMMGKLNKLKNINIPYVDKLPREAAAEKEMLQSLAIKSLLTVPIVYESNLIGHLGFESVNNNKIWQENTMVLLELVAQNIADVLQRKKTLEILEESENYYRTVFENTGNATAILDEDLNITKVNNKFENVSGYLKEEIENKKNWIDFIPKVDHQKVMSYYHLRTINIATPREYEIGFIDKIGNIKTILISVDIILRTSKRVISFVDISQQKQTQKEIEENLDKMHRILNETVGSLATALEIRDPYTAGHQKKLAELAVAIGKEMGLTKNQIDGISVAGNLHDIGKINVPSEILSKPGKLTELERLIIKTHCQAGYEIIKEIEFPWPVADIVLQHHERIDGTGYPQGLTGSEILLEARILAVADVIEAMASHRPYRPSLGIDAALEEISKNKGSLYDPEIVDTCINLFREKKFTWDSLPLN